MNSTNPTEPWWLGDRWHEQEPKDARSKANVILAGAFALTTLIILIILYGACAKSVHDPISTYVFWEIAANGAMIVYMLLYDWVELRPTGVLGAIPLEHQSTIRLWYGIAALLLIASTVCSVLNAFGAFSWFHTIFPQLILLLLFSIVITAADWRVHNSVNRQLLKVQYRLFVYLVDGPMVLGFSVVLLFAIIKGLTDSLDDPLKAFASGAIAFQVIAFNLMFALLDRFPKSLVRGRTALLLGSDGEVAERYTDFQSGWTTYWNTPTE